MNTQFSLHVVHPTFELLKRSARLLHFIAASVIIINAVHQLQQLNADKLLCYSQIFIGADILVLVFFGANAMNEQPRINLIFRLIEIIFLMGIGLAFMSEGELLLGFGHLLFGVGFGFIFHRERRIAGNDSVDISHTGITVPNFLKDTELSWPDIKSIIPKYHSIIIETLHNKKIQFQLSRNLKIEELEQINDFCTQHVGNG